MALSLSLSLSLTHSLENIVVEWSERVCNVSEGVCCSYVLVSLIVPRHMPSRADVYQEETQKTASSSQASRLLLQVMDTRTRSLTHAAPAQRYAKISNKSSFGIIDNADSSTSDRIIVTVSTACLIDDGAYRCR